MGHNNAQVAIEIRTDTLTHRDKHMIEIAVNCTLSSGRESTFSFTEHSLRLVYYNTLIEVQLPRR